MAGPDAAPARHAAGGSNPRGAPDPGADRFLTLLRHGEVIGGGRFRGTHDDPLAPRGQAQLAAAIAAETVAGRGDWDAILCSPARRCAAFAADLAAAHHRPLRCLPALRERGFGAWEGQRAEQLPTADLARFWADPLGFDPPGAEPFANFRARVSAGWQALLADPPRHALLLTHGGVVRVILGEVLGLSAAALLLIEVPPACCTRLRLPSGSGRPSLIAHGALD